MPGRWVNAGGGFRNVKLIRIFAGKTQSDGKSREKRYDDAGREICADDHAPGRAAGDEAGSPVDRQYARVGHL